MFNEQNETDAGTIAHEMKLAIANRVGWFSLVSSLLFTNAGCTGSWSLSPQGRLDAWKAEIAQQHSLCQKLERLGADCDARFSKAPYVHVTLGEKWRGGKEGLATLGRLQRVDELTLRGTTVNDKVLSRAVSLPKLSILHIHKGVLSARSAARLRKARGLIGLELREVDLPAEAWKQICRLNLIWLHVEACSGVFSTDVPRAGQLGRLVSLRLTGKSIDDMALRRVARLSELRALEVRRSSITDAGVAHLSRLTKLAHLDLSFTRVRKLTPLASLKNLTELVLDDSLCNDASLEPATGLNALESISLNNTTITDNGIAHLTKMQNLRVISLMGTKATDTSLKTLSSISTLITVIDANGDVVLFQRRWLESSPGNHLRHWAVSRSKKLFLWTDGGRERL